MRQMKESGVEGFGDLRAVLGNMGSGIEFPAPWGHAAPVDPSLK